jgi:hypothetical protein
MIILEKEISSCLLFLAAIGILSSLFMYSILLHKNEVYKQYFWKKGE